jgi:DNA topoisomerase-2
MAEEIKKDATEKYQLKTEIEHILDRSGMWIGSITPITTNFLLYKPSENKIIETQGVPYIAGLHKLCDEIISNSIDEFRSPESLFRIKNLKIEVFRNGTVSVYDDGGISVKIHKKTQILIPKLIFGYLRTSSNYDDTISRQGVGTNGLGSKLTNIFSTKFEVETCDGQNKVICTWENNMRDYSNTDFVPTKQHYTKTTFKIDLKRFNLKELDLGFARILQKRCIDAAAVNRGLIVEFKTDIIVDKLDSKWVFNSFEDYVKLHLSQNLLQQVKTLIKPNLCLLVTPNNGFNLGFVNGASCLEGTHMKKIRTQIATAFLDICHKNEMQLLTDKDVLNHISIFVNCTISNPTYDAQTKKELTNKISKNELFLDEKFINDLTAKDGFIYQSLVDYYNIKYVKEEKKLTDKLNKAIKLTSVKKLIKCAGSKKHNNELWLFEGLSASNGFRENRSPLLQAAYLLRGKILNTFALQKAEIFENLELRELCAILDIQFNKPKENIKNLKFSKIIIATDMDFDGSHIAGLLLVFFVIFFIELVKAGIIYRALSPIIIGRNKKTNKKIYFYTQDEFLMWETINKSNLNDYIFVYTKGLGGLDNEDYDIMLNQQRLVQFTLEDAKDLESIKIWFSKATEQRKEILMADTQILYGEDND